MFIEAIVTSVDMEKGFCRCKSLSTGETLINVRWVTPLGEAPAAPEHGEQVFIAQTQSGYWILGGMSLGSSQRLNTSSMLDGLFDGNVNRGITANINGYGNVTNSLDHIPGDQVLAARGGSFVAALVGGVALFKASPLVQIVGSAFGAVLKVFAINFERFTDAATTEEKNVGGRTFVKKEVYDTQAHSRSDIPVHYEVIGDVEAGTTGATRTTKVKREVVQTARDVIPLLVEETYLDGKKVETTQTADAAQKAVVTRQNDLWKVDVSGGAGESFINITDLLIQHSTGQATLTLNHDGSVTLVCTTLGVNANSATFTVPSSTFTGTIHLGSGADIIGANGVGLLTHKHSDPQGGTTGTPVP